MNLNDAEALARWKYGAQIDLIGAKDRRRMIKDAETFLQESGVRLEKSRYRVRCVMFSTKRRFRPSTGKTIFAGRYKSPRKERPNDRA